MSGIPVYTQSPINTATKPSGITPQTASSDQPSRTTGPASVEAFPTAIPTSLYPSAQPGSRPPAPTGVAQNYTPLQPTATTSAQHTGPPAPQPGAFPTPNKTAVPPPPRVGEKYEPPAAPQPSNAPSYLPPQMNLPAPTQAIGSHAQPTSTTNAPSFSHPVGLPAQESSEGRKSLEHPPGYQQNTYASEMSADQRRAQESNQNQSTYGLPVQGGSGGGFEEESVWNTAKGWASQAGQKLSAVEAEVWKKINK